MTEKPSKGRAEIHQDLHSLTIKIPSKKNWFIIIFTTAWMGGWLIGELFAINTLFFSDTPLFANLFLLVWLTLWTVGGIFMLISIIQQLIGYETISVKKGILEIKRTAGITIQKKLYEIKSIRHIDINPTIDLGMWSGAYLYRQNIIGFKNGKIKFDYGMKTIKFANDIEEAEARIIIEIFKENPNFKEDNFA